MIRLQEVFDDPSATKPVRVETGTQHIADEKEFIKWCRERGKVQYLTYDLLTLTLRVIPRFMIEYIKDTGNAIRINDLGILKIRYADNQLSLTLRNDKSLVKELNDSICQIDKYITNGRTKFRFGGRMATPRNLLK